MLYFLRSTAASIRGPQSNLALRLKHETCHHQKDFCLANKQAIPPKNNSAMENQPFEYDIPPTENDEVLIFSGKKERI